MYYLKIFPLKWREKIHNILSYLEATSSSDATSRETTPESDDENEDEEQDEDDDDDAFADEDTTTYNRNEIVNDESIPLKDYRSNPVRDVEELIASYRNLFPEYEVN